MESDTVFSTGRSGGNMMSTSYFLLTFHGVRYSLLYRKVRRKYDVDIQRSLEFVLAKGQIGDWFVLYQLSKNCNPYFYREFIKELAKDMREKPKKSKSNAGSSTGGSVKKLKPLEVER